MNDTHQDIVDRLSEFIDGELEARERGHVERHLETCEACRAVAAELRAVAAEAAALFDRPPANDLWDGVSERIAAHGAGRIAPFRTRARRFSFTLPQLAAASIALMVLSGSMVWLARTGDPRADFPATSGEELPAVAPASLADSHYEGAVEDLEATLERGRAQLDPETVRVLEQNLQSIDAAIEQCRQALAKDPANAYLNNHLAAARQRKLALLRRATALTAGS
jgi:hypothetical protein